MFEDIGTANIPALEVLATEPPNAKQQRQAAVEFSHAHPAPLWAAGEVEEWLHIEKGFAQTCLSALVRYGLAEVVNTYGQVQSYCITQFGRVLLDAT